MTPFGEILSLAEVRAGGAEKLADRTRRPSIVKSAADSSVTLATSRSMPIRTTGSESTAD